MANHLATFLQTIRTEAETVSALLTHDFSAVEGLVERIIKNDAKLVVTGLGKSGLIGKKIAATLSSTGTPSVFLHASEACHGDVGMIRPPDMVLAISHSGETEELLQLTPYLKRNHIHLTVMTGNLQSTLARHADCVLDARITGEACPFKLAPTSSSTAALVLGDALAMALMRARRFSAEDFATCHPAGALGRLLLTPVESVMHRENLPRVAECIPVAKLPPVMREGRFGLVVVENDAGEVVGIVTDGDLRRAMEEGLHDREDCVCAGDSAPQLTAKDIMTKEPRRIAPGATLFDARELLLAHKITALLVMDGPAMVGIVQIYDL